jgi:hypothetical protein
MFVHCKRDVRDYCIVVNHIFASSYFKTDALANTPLDIFELITNIIYYLRMEGVTLMPVHFKINVTI